MPNCIIINSERRFIDAVHYWNELQSNYFNPDVFRRNLNSTFQELRNITFLIQKQKGKIKGFDQWYSVQREILSKDPICKWSVDARNTVTKKGDLNTSSLARATFISDWLGQRTTEFKIPINIPSKLLNGYILDKVPKNLIVEESIVCVERKWIDSEFSDFEIGYAIGHCLKVLARLINNFHETFEADGKDSPVLCQNKKVKQFLETYPVRNANANELKKTYIKLANLKCGSYEFKTTNLGLGVDDLEDAKKRYSTDEFERKVKEFSFSTLSGFVEYVTETSKVILKKDKFLPPILHIYTQDNHYRTIMFRFEDRPDKHIQLRMAADVISQMEIKYVALSGEAWVAAIEDMKSIEQPHPVDARKRREAISVGGIDSNGQEKGINVFFRRKFLKIEFMDTQTTVEPANILAPIRKAISKSK